MQFSHTLIIVINIDQELLRVSAAIPSYIVISETSVERFKQDIVTAFRQWLNCEKSDLPIADIELSNDNRLVTVSVSTEISEIVAQTALRVAVRHVTH